MPSPRYLACLPSLLLFLTACSGGSDPSGLNGGDRASDRSLGAADAIVTFTEYASVACTHCAAFHEAVWPTMEIEFIETGQVRYVFREMIAGPPQVAMAGFALAHCVAEDRYFDAIDLLFQQQRAIFSAMQSAGGARGQYTAIGRALGLGESELETCWNDESITSAILAAHDQANDDGIARTPTFFIDGHPLEDRPAAGQPSDVWYLGGDVLEDENGPIPAAHTADSLRRALNAAIARANNAEPG